MKEVVALSVSDQRIGEFIVKMNQAFFARATEKMPVSEIKVQDLEKNQELFALAVDGKLVSGLAFSFEEDGVYIKHVWCDVNEQGKGYASFLMDEIIKIARERDYLELKLGVCFMYKPAVNLYKRKGFKIYAYRTHTPYTYCHYGMVKRLKNGGIFFELKRMVCRLFQKIKHFLLFKKDGTPKLLYKIFSKNK